MRLSLFLQLELLQRVLALRTHPSQGRKRHLIGEGAIAAKFRLVIDWVGRLGRAKPSLTRRALRRPVPLTAQLLTTNLLQRSQRLLPLEEENAR